MTTVWFKTWHGLPYDKKFMGIAHKTGVKRGVVTGLFMALLDHASQNDPRGSIDGFDLDDYAAFSEFEISDLEKALSAMQGKLLDGDFILNWEKRQEGSESASTARVRAFRERKKAENAINSSDETPCNVTETHVTQCNDKIEEKDIRLRYNYTTLNTRENFSEFEILENEPTAAESATSECHQAQPIQKSRTTESKKPDSQEVMRLKDFFGDRNHSQEMMRFAQIACGRDIPPQNLMICDGNFHKIMASGLNFEQFEQFLRKKSTATAGSWAYFVRAAQEEASRYAEAAAPKAEIIPFEAASFRKVYSEKPKSFYAKEALAAQERINQRFLNNGAYANG